MKSWELALADIPTDDLLPAYQRAAARYTDAERPFGVPQVREGWELYNAERQRLARIAAVENERLSAREHLADRYHCSHCRDRRYQFVRHADGVSSAKLCECSGGTRAMCAQDGWLQNERGEWYRPSWQQAPEPSPVQEDEVCIGCGVIKENNRCEMCD